MRLRYFRVQNYPPLEDIGVVFSADAYLKTECRIRFVVGINGSGKTNLLQALTETLLCLERRKRPHFPVTLAYELGRGEDRQTLVFDNLSGDYAWWASEPGVEAVRAITSRTGWDDLVAELRQGKPGWRLLTQHGWPGAGTGLPKVVLAYTTGQRETWQTLFREEPLPAGVDQVSQSTEYQADMERPAGWSRAREIRQRLDEGRIDEAKELQKQAEQAAGVQDSQRVCLFITPTLLKFALLAVTLGPGLAALRGRATEAEEKAHIEALRLRREDPAPSLDRLLLEKIDWVWPVSVSLDIDFRSEEWSISQAKWMQPLFYAATMVVREPAPGVRRRLHFDFKAPTPSRQVPEWSGEGATLSFGLANGHDLCGQALLNFLGGAKNPPFLIFQTLLDLYHQGLIADISLAMRKTQPEDILLFDELSDGEQMFLGRMAVIHLLHGQDDALLIMDEPETHFNDSWKREIVAVIDQALGEAANDVLISTHSAIVLSDVFQDEIVLLEKSENGPRRIDLVSPTFGGDPGELMIRLFGADASIGERSRRWLKARLAEMQDAPDSAKLEDLISHVGPGAPRARLRALLYRLLEQNATSDPTA